MINDLLIEHSLDDVRELKKANKLDDLLRFYNCNIGQLSKENFAHILPLLNKRHSFAVKTHNGPGNYLAEISIQFQIKFTYIFRDPRAVALSAFDHGNKLREEGNTGWFSGIQTFEESVLFARSLFCIWDKWVNYPNSFVVKYEDLVMNPKQILCNISEYLEMEVDLEKIDKVILANLPGKKEGSHFNMGDPYRYQKVWTREQLNDANNQLKEMILKMGYDL